MIDRLIATLQEKGLLLSDREIDAGSEAQSLLDEEDIADALWLAAHIGGTLENPEERSWSPEDSSDVPLNPLNPVSLEQTGTVIPPPPVVSAFIADETNTEAPTSETPERGMPIQVQAAPALPDPREIGRSLRPFMRKVASLTRFELDEMATVNCIAEHDLWFPILKASPERWFDLELVIEESRFSFLWQDTLQEFQKVLEYQGAFRHVRSWRVQTNDRGEPKLVTQKQGITPDSVLPSRSPKELLDASGRRLVLFVSDCRSSLWKHGQIHDWLALWSRHNPVAIVQLLPERLWPESELDVGFSVQVESLMPGVPNSGLIVRELQTRTSVNPNDSLLLPVVTLSVGALQQWALVVAGAGRQRAPARLFDLAWVKDPHRDRGRGVVHPSTPEACVELFMATASPIAQQLAKMMAAVPVELAVVHLIQQELLPEAKSVHIAEVFTSGLLKAIEDSQGNYETPERYDFVDGVRDILNAQSYQDETLDVIETLSQRIARTLGFEIKSFTALLLPKSDWSQEEKNAILPFAQITTEVLHRLGGEYAELAELVERDARKRRDWIQSIPGSEPDILDWPELETLTFIDAELVERNDGEESEQNWPPSLQTEEYDVATIASVPAATPITTVHFVTEPFSFKVGYLVNLGSGWVVQTSDGQARRYIEQLNVTSSLEMVAIPGGTFMMGSPKDEKENMSYEQPQHPVTVPDFYLGRYPITQAQWRVVADLLQVEEALDPEPSHFKGDSRPVESVSWEEAIEFCARLSEQTKREYRLPTEAEWEYACRAGTTTPFHVGETISSELANYDGRDVYGEGVTGEYRGETTPVDHFGVANAWGLCDMHGNVWEWCQDHWHDNYEGAPNDGSAWLSSNPDAVRVWCGGSWYSYPRICRSAYRINYDLGDRYGPLGFRVACSAPGNLRNSR